MDDIQIKKQPKKYDAVIVGSGAGGGQHAVDPVVRPGGRPWGAEHVLRAVEPHRSEARGMNRLALICAREALYEYVLTHHEHPESVCQFPRSN